MPFRTILCLLLPLCLVAPLVHAVAQEGIRPTRRFSIPTLVTAVGWSDDGKLVVWDPAGYSTWDPASGRRQSREPVFAKACQKGRVLPRSEDGMTVAITCRNRLLAFTAATAAPLGEWTLRENQTAAAFTVAAQGPVAAVVLAGATRTVEVLNRSTGASPTAIQAAQEIGGLHLSADGSRLTTGSFTGVQIWDLPEGKERHRVQGGPAHALSADGQLLAIARDEGVALMDASTGAVRTTLKGPSSQLRFSPDGAHLIGWTNQQLVVWDIASAAQRVVLRSDRFVTAALSSDGTRLVTVSLDLRGDGTTSELAVWSVGG